MFKKKEKKKELDLSKIEITDDLDLFNIVKNKPKALVKNENVLDEEDYVMSQEMSMTAE